MSTTDPAFNLRNAMVDELVAQKLVRSEAVESAMRTVPRHVFAPWLSLEDAYANQAWVIPSSTPEAPATISQPAAVAMMLEGFDLQSGFSVLEIGAGTGYNAALMAYIVGPKGQINTVDIEAYLVTAAATVLADLANVQVIHGDGGEGFPQGAPYDRIVATVGAWDLPPAWHEQLAPLTGRLVIPLHISGSPEDHLLVSFRRQEEILVGVSIGAYKMVLMRGCYGHQQLESPRQKGLAWQGASSDDLQLTAYPHSAAYQLRPHEMAIDKPSVRLVLARESEDQRLREDRNA